MAFAPPRNKDVVVKQVEEVHHDDNVAIIRNYLVPPTRTPRPRDSGDAEQITPRPGRRPLAKVLAAAIPNLHNDVPYALTEACMALVQISKWFKDLPSRRRTEFMRKSKYESFKAKRYVCRQGEEADKFYIVLRGNLDVKIRTRDGEGHWSVKTTATIGAGDTFGDIAITANVPRAATCFTICDTELLSLDKDAYIELIVKSGALMQAAKLAQELKWWRKNVWCTSGVDDGVVTALIRAASIFQYEKDEKLHIGETTLLYFIKTGMVQLMFEQQVLTELKEGQFVGDASMFGLPQHKWTARMATPVEFLVIPHQYLSNRSNVPEYMVDRLRMEAELRHAYCAPRCRPDMQEFRLHRRGHKPSDPIWLSFEDVKKKREGTPESAAAQKPPQRLHLRIREHKEKLKHAPFLSAR